MSTTPKTPNDILRDAVDAYFNETNPSGTGTQQQDMRKMTRSITRISNNMIEEHNAAASTQYKTLHGIKPIQIALAILRTKNMRMIDMCSIPGKEPSRDTAVLGVYLDSGANQGLYTTDTDYMAKLIRDIKPDAYVKEVKEVLDTLANESPLMPRCCDPDLIAVRNGIFNYKTKQLMPFTPEHIFLTKTNINYNPNARNTTIHNDQDGKDWDVESWMASLFDKPEITNLAWQVIGAAIRPTTRWGKMILLYSREGVAGKSSIMELIRGLCGNKRYNTVFLKDFRNKTYLERIPDANAIIADNNYLDKPLDQIHNLKELVEGLPITVRKKYKQPITTIWQGLIIEGAEGKPPRIQDNTNDNYIIIQMNRRFYGNERKCIAEDYLHNRDVLEYVLHKVLHMDYYELDVPTTCMPSTVCADKH